ncbi:MAG: 50S ribosomal protein L6 [Bacteroidales bacterium]|nr:50S ribosomal protein L6 [Bacteroidales bacterium]
MSRIGKLPITLPEGVTIEVSDDNIVTVKGPKGELTQEVNPVITIKQEDNRVIIERPTEQKDHRSLHGLYRSLINNMVEGVSKGYEKKLELVGVGYRAETKGQLLELSLGYSHDIIFELPPEIKAEAVTQRRSNPVITLTSIDKQLIGHIASKIRSMRKPEPYKGKGIKFVGEQIRRKAGKSASV